MGSNLIICPLCVQPAFQNADALRIGLVSVATRTLSCPICYDLLVGLDKLTIHLFGHMHGIIQIPKDESTVSQNMIISQNNNLEQTLPDSNFKNLKITTCENSIYKNSVINSSDQVSNSINTQKHLINIETNVLQSMVSNGVMFQVKDIGSFLQDNIVATKYNDSFNLKPVIVTNDDSNKLNKNASNNNNDNNVSIIKVTTVNKTINSDVVKSRDGTKRKTVQILPKPVLLPKSSTETKQFIPCSGNDLSKNSYQQLPQLEWVNGFCVGSKPIFVTDSMEQNANDKNVDAKVTDCNICGIQFNDEQILKMHCSLVHSVSTELNINGDKVYRCHLCSKRFRMRGSLTVHLKVAHYGFSKLTKQMNAPKSTESSASLSCSVCGKIFTKFQQLNSHLKTHENKQWECEVCSKLFTTKYFLKKHKRLHTGEMPYHCIQCNKAFTFQQSYHKHLQYHSTDKPHMCVECGRSFKELSTLHNHERIHSGERPFACETCGKCFRQRVSYLVHKRIHTGAMPYQCTACGKSFRYKVSQRTHKCPAEPPGTVIRQSGEFLQKLQQKKRNDTLSEISANQKTIINGSAHDCNSSVDNTNILNDNVEYKDNNFSGAFEKDSSTNYDQETFINKNISENDITDTISKTNENIDLIKNTDFFSMVLSPIKYDLSSPSEKLQNLCLSIANENLNEKTFDKDIQENHIFCECLDDSFINKQTQENVILETIDDNPFKQFLYDSNQ